MFATGYAESRAVEVNIPGPGFGNRLAHRCNDATTLADAIQLRLRPIAAQHVLTVLRVRLELHVAVLVVADVLLSREVAQGIGRARNADMLVCATHRAHEAPSPFLVTQDEVGFLLPAWLNLP